MKVTNVKNQDRAVIRLLQSKNPNVKSLLVDSVGIESRFEDQLNNIFNSQIERIRPSHDIYKRLNNIAKNSYYHWGFGYLFILISKDKLTNDIVLNLEKQLDDRGEVLVID